MRYLTAIIILAVASSLLATNPTTPSQSLTVVAPSGLTLRQAPDANSPAIKIVPYGDQVIVRHDQPDTTFNQRISWVDGEWIVVEHEGEVGFIFDGYLSKLPLPSTDAEYSPYDLELIYPLEVWMNNHHIHAAQPDTILRSERSKVVHNYINGNSMVQSNQHDYYKVEVYLHDTRLMDAYHLLLGMLDDEGSAEIYRTESTFIADKNQEVTRIKIDLDSHIDIRLIGPDVVRIQLISVEQYCDL